MSDLATSLVTAAGFAIGSFFLAQLSRWIFRNAIRRAYKKTESTLDDAIFKSLERPLMLLAIIFGIYEAVTIVLMDAGGLSSPRAAMHSGKYICSAGSENMAHQVRVLKKFINAVIWAIVIALVLNQLGYKISALLATLGIAGLAVALALQDTLANVFAGFCMMSDRSVKASDYIKLDSGEEGFVEDIGWRNTRIRLWANNTVVLPNAKLIQSTITNYDLPQQQLSVYISCGIGYSSDLDQVEEVTIDVGRKVLGDVPGAVIDFEPIVLFKEVGNPNINFLVVLRSVDEPANILYTTSLLRGCIAAFTRKESRYLVPCV